MLDPAKDRRFLERASRIFSVLQSTTHIEEPISALPPQEREALMASMADLIARGRDRDIVQLAASAVPGFAQAWARLEAEGVGARLRIIETLARGEYSTAIEVQGVDVHLEGDGAESIVMIHGWPDTYRLWDATVEALKSRYRCIRFTLPGFDPRFDGRAYTLDELLAFLGEVIERTSPGKKVILMLHDWGCFFGYQFYARNPGKVSRIVGVDIGDPGATARTMTRREKTIMLAYQTWNALAWRIGGGIGDWMIRAMASLASCPSDRAPMSWRMGYPYYVLWFGGRDSFRGQVRRFAPTCPMLFVYGVRKPLRFHSPQWAAELKEKRGNDVVEFDTGHWVMSNQPQRFNQVVGDWLARGA